MPPAQCPECGRFLAAVFVQQLENDPAPCPRCGTELSWGEQGPASAAAPVEAPAVPPPAATLPDDTDTGPDPVPAASARTADGHGAGRGVVDDDDRDPLAGWDDNGAVSRVLEDELDPTAVAAGAGVGLLVGLLLGGRDHRWLGALLGAAAGAVAVRLRE